MNLYTQYRIRNNANSLRYLRENSNWYKQLNRDPNSYNEFVKEMKVKYKLRTIDKIDNFVDTVDLVTKIINISNE